MRYPQPSFPVAITPTHTTFPTSFNPLSTRMLPAPNRIVHFDIETRCKIRVLSRRAPEEFLCVDCQCLFRNVAGEGFQHAVEDTRVEEDKQTMGGKNEGRAFCGDDAEEQW